MRNQILLIFILIISLWFQLKFLSRLNLHPNEITYNKFCQQQNITPFDNLTCTNTEQNSKFIMLIFDSLSLDLINQLQKHDFSFGIKRTDQAPLWLKPNISLYRFHKNLSNEFTINSQYFKLFTGNSPRHVFSNVLTRDSIFDQFKIANYSTSFIGTVANSQELPIDFLSKITDEVKLFEEEESYPLQHLCQFLEKQGQNKKNNQEEYNIDQFSFDYDEEKDLSNEENTDTLLKSNEVGIQANHIINATQKSMFLKYLEGIFNKKLSMKSINVCLNETTKNFTRSIIYFSTIFQQYSKNFGQKNMLTIKTALALQSTIQKMALWNNAHPDYELIFIGVPPRQREQSKFEEKLTQKKKQRQNLNKTKHLGKSNGSRLLEEERELNQTEEQILEKENLLKIISLDQIKSSNQDEKKFQQISQIDKLLEESLQNKKENLTKQNEANFNSSGFMFTFIPDKNFSTMLNITKNLNKLVVENRDEAELYGFKWDNITDSAYFQNGKKESNISKMTKPNIKSRPFQKYSPNIVKEITQVKTDIYNIYPQAISAILSSQLQGINIPISSDYDDNVLKYIQSDIQKLLALRRTEIQQITHYFHHKKQRENQISDILNDISQYDFFSGNPFLGQNQIKQVHKKKNQLFEDQKIALFECDLFRAFEQAHVLVDLEPVATKEIFNDYNLVIQQIFEKVKELKKTYYTHVDWKIIFFASIFGISFILVLFQVQYEQSQLSKKLGIFMMILCTLIFLSDDIFYFYNTDLLIKDDTITSIILQGIVITQYILIIMFIFSLKSLFYDVCKFVKIAENSHSFKEYCMKIFISFNNQQAISYGPIQQNIKNNQIQKKDLEENRINNIEYDDQLENDVLENSLFLKTIYKQNNEQNFVKEINGVGIILILILLLNVIWVHILQIDMKNLITESNQKHIEMYFYFIVMSCYIAALSSGYKEYYFDRSLKISVSAVYRTYYLVILILIQVSTYLQLVDNSKKFGTFLFNFAIILLLLHTFYLLLNKTIYKKKVIHQKLKIKSANELVKSFYIPISLMGILQLDLNYKIFIFVMLLPMLYLYKILYKKFIYSSSKYKLLKISLFLATLIKQMDIIYLIQKQELDNENSIHLQQLNQASENVNLYDLIFNAKNSFFGKHLIVLLESVLIWSILSAYFLQLNKYGVKIQKITQKEQRKVKKLVQFGKQILKKIYFQIDEDLQYLLFSILFQKFGVTALEFEINFKGNNENNYLILLQRMAGLSTFFITYIVPILINSAQDLLLKIIYK